MRHTLVILACVCMGLFVVADLLVRVLFEPEFEPMAPALRILLPGAAVYGLAAAFSGYYTYQRGKPWAAAIVAGLGLVVDILLALLLVPRFGVNGAAIASTVAYSVAMVVGVAAFLRSAHLRPSDALRFGKRDVDDYRALFARVRALVARRQ